LIQSIAAVATDRPERYLKQLVSHMGRKAEADQNEAGDSGTIRFASGTCALAAEPGVLRLTATAEDTERLARVQDVVARHLVRFAAQDELTVEWAAAVGV